MSEQTSLQASPLEMQHCSQSGDQAALNGAAVEQEERRDSVKGRKVKHAPPQQEGFSAVGAVALWSARHRQHT